MFPRPLLGGACGLLSLAVVAEAIAAVPLCREVRVAFAPDCFRAKSEAPCSPRKNGTQLDLGAQIAVWVEKNGGAFVDTVMVTSAVGTRGIGNRPGRWDFQSAPRFPYGRRPHALPIWAFARGQLYDLVVFQDGREGWLGFHESVSSPDPYYCRPMGLDEVDVDAITCPTAVFNSAKGRFDQTQKTPYPPRNDLVSFTDRDCDRLSADNRQDCARSAELFAAKNDLDAVSRATPEFGRTYEVRRLLPADLSAGSYRVRLEINKEFDQNNLHRYEAYADPQLSESGVGTNIGQPSVLFEVPLEIGAAPAYANTSKLAGYGEWNGQSGRVHPPDSTISGTPGSGEGRLMAVPNPWASPGAMARVHVMTSSCDVQAQPGEGEGQPCHAPAPPTDLAPRAISPTSATFSFTHAGDGEAPVGQYEVRYREGRTMNEEEFLASVPAAVVSPGRPGTPGAVELSALKPLTRYVVGIRAKADCGAATATVTLAFETKQVVYTQLSGCFVATAALGSPWAKELHPLRRLRDQVSVSGGLGAALVQSYYLASPPLADAIADSELARALARAALGPAFELAMAFTKPQTQVGPGR